MKRRHFIKGMALYTPGLVLPFMPGMERHFSKAQPEDPRQTACDTICEIDQATVTLRETNFANWKLPYLNQGQDNKCIPVDPNNFLAMLNRFAQSTSPAYNGMRVYFASGDLNDNNPSGLPASQVGKLIVIFVPTKANSNSALHPGGDDDPAQFWFLYNDVKNNVNINYNLPPEIAGRWINNYRNNLRGGTNGLNAHGRPGVTNFNDTGSIWYKMISIAGGMVGSAQDCGIIGYISGRLGPGATDPITSMTIAFGAYDTTEKPPFSQYYYYLLSQFDFYQEKSNTHFSFGSSSGGEFVRKRHPFGKDRKPLTDGTTDTGLPCPPADSCNGALYPD
jgi:hypothetical protein